MGSTASVTHAVGAVVGGRRASAGRARVDAVYRGLDSSRFSVPVTFVSTKAYGPWVTTCGLCRVAVFKTTETLRMTSRINALSVIEPTTSVGRGVDVESDRRLARRFEVAHQGFTQMACATGYQHAHNFPLTDIRCAPNRRVS